MKFHRLLGRLNVSEKLFSLSASFQNTTKLKIMNLPIITISYHTHLPFHCFYFPSSIVNQFRNRKVAEEVIENWVLPMQVLIKHLQHRFILIIIQPVLPFTN